MGFFLKNFTAYGAVVKHASCRTCQAAYVYVLALRQDSDNCQSQREAREILSSKLDTQRGIVPCPDCAEYPPEMVEAFVVCCREHAKRIRIWFLAGSAALVFFAIAVFLSNRFDINYPSRGWKHARAIPPTTFLFAAVGVLTVGLVLYSAAPLWVRQFEPNRRSLNRRREAASRLAIRSDKATSAGLQRMLHEAISEIETSIARKRRRMAWADLAFSLTFACITLSLGFACILIWPSAFKPGGNIVFACIFLGLTLFSLVGVPSAWRRRNATFPELADSVARVAGYQETLAAKPWSQKILGGGRPKLAPEPDTKVLDEGDVEDG